MSSKKRREKTILPNKASKSAIAEKDAAGESTTSLVDVESNFKVLLSMICFAALFLRCISILQTIETPTAVQLLGDAKGYYDWAVRIASGQWYGTETFYQAPLYPYFLAVQIKLFGSGLVSIRLFQGLLGAISVAAIGFAGKNFFKPSIGLLASCFYAIYPAAIYFDGIIQKTSLASFLLCVFLALISLVWKEIGNEARSRKLMLLGTTTGITLALLMITRENSILWVPVFPVWIWLTKTIPTKIKLKTICSYVVGLVTILLPIAARNASLGGEWSPTTFQAGPNFYIGNNLSSNGLYQPLVQGHETPMYERADAQRIAEQATGKPLSSREVSKYWFGQAWNEISSAPMSWIELMAIKSLMVINRFEVPDVECFYIYSIDAWPLKILGSGWHFGILFPLCVWGLLTRFDHRRQLWILDALLLIMIAAIVLFFILGRYRQPLVPIAVLFAAVGITDIVKRIRNRDRSSIRLSIGASLTALILCNLPVHDESMLRASSYMNMGIAAGKAGNMGVSIPALYQAIESHPEMVEAYVNLGKAMEMSNRPNDAIACYQAALQIEPSLIMVDAALGKIYAQLGEQGRAIGHLQRAIQLDPDDQQSLEILKMLGANQTE